MIYKSNIRLYAYVTENKLRYEIQGNRGNTLVQIWDKMKKPFNFAWRAGVIVIAAGMICGLFSEFMGWLWCYIEGDSYETEYLSDTVKDKYYTDGSLNVSRS